jgi:hypothetical protein
MRFNKFLLNISLSHSVSIFFTTLDSWVSNVNQMSMPATRLSQEKLCIWTLELHRTLKDEPLLHT